MIHTSYFGNLKNIPKNVVPISICAKAPTWYKGIQYKKLAPTYNLLMKWKQDHDEKYYVEHFKNKILSKLDAKKIAEELYSKSNGNSIVLVCYEKTGYFCHRHIVSEWLNNNGIECRELF